jgi:Nidogen-like
MSAINPVAKLSMAVFSAVAVCASMAGSASAAAIRTGFSSNSLAANDDGSAPVTSLGFTANFFGNNFSQTYVNNNGNLTFTGSLSTYSPFGLNGATSTPIIAAFFSDVDTRGTGSSIVTYGTGTANGHNAFAANYVNVGYFPNGTDKLNSFQIVLVDRADTGAGNFDIEFNYDKTQWDLNNARIGYSNGSGTPGSYYEFAGSGVSGAFLDGGPAGTSLIANSLNSDGVLGRYTFNARNGTVNVPPADPNAVPEPADFVGTALAGFAVVALKRKLATSKKS